MLHVQICFLLIRRKSVLHVQLVFLLIRSIGLEAIFIVVPRLALHDLIFLFTRITNQQGPRSKFSSGGAKEECVKENFGGGGAGGGMLVHFYSISLK